MPAVMDHISSKAFKPIQPDGYMLNSLGKEAPKIEITETESLCQGPLSPAGCEVALCEWDDIHHHGDIAADPSGNPHHHECSDHRRGSLSRRSEGGPGKCPSPSRNSPRRHSPVPYSPKRQNRTRSSASSVASEEFPDVSLSPRRQSPALGSPQAERPSSLSLASGSVEEFICVSYGDPFSSPTITRTSEAILAISINCSHDHGDDQDVEMVPQDRGDAESTGYLDGSDVVSSSDCPATRTSMNGSKAMRHEESFRGTAQNSVYGKQDENRRDIPDGSVWSGENSAFQQSDRTVADEHHTPVASGSRDTDVEVVEAPSDGSNRERDEGVGRMESVEREDDFHMDGVTDSDSSSDDEMIDFVTPPHGVDIPMDQFSTGCAVPPHRRSHAVTLCTQRSCLWKCPQSRQCGPQPSSCEPGPDSCEQVDGTVIVTASSSDSSECRNTQTAAIEIDRTQSRDDLSPAQSLPNDLSRPSGGAGGCWAARRASCPDHHCGLCSSLLSSCSSTDTSSRRSQCQHVSKTPEDFALSCVVGSPPLTFPHCQYAILVHCSLPSPYDPDLPTPPIVLTPHTSYEDLHFDSINSDSSLIPGAKAGVGAVHERGSKEDKSVPLQRPDISRSRSFPKLNHNDDQFQEPDQAWPVLGPVDSGQGRQRSAREPRGGNRWEHRRSSDSECGGAGVSDVTDMAEEGPASSVSLPGSPARSRVAVIGRLRRVVERRLSGTSISMEEAALLEGGGP